MLTQSLPARRAEAGVDTSYGETDFDEFVAAHWVPLFRTAYLLTGDYHLAEDLLQTAFTKAYLKWSRVSQMQQPLAYTRKIVTNSALSWWRRRSTSELPTQYLHRENQASHEDHVTQTAVVRSALAALPPRQRAVMVLRYYEDLSEAEIAETLGISTGSVKSYAASARKTLVQRLSPHPPDHTNGEF